MGQFKQTLLLIVVTLFFLPEYGNGQGADTSSVILPDQHIMDELDLGYQHSPHKATMYSAVLPGLGQIYNGKAWKVPILYAGIGGVAYAIHFNSKYYDKYRSAYRDFLIRDPGNTSYEEFIPPTLSIDDVHGQYSEWFQRALDNKRRYYRRYRDISYIGMAAIYFVNIIDAAVDAHFYDFDISDDLTMRIEPSVIGGIDYERLLGMHLQIKF
ncbi:DUF5683 domain-containing protein [Marinilabiliaceae bacterium ANBcel2]|nr:DUF5683 domain-containing protein [Marinilabiliaceae bacterium ANBcel2]